MNDLSIGDIAVIIPVFCPDCNILKVIEGIQASGFKYLYVVDDGSYMGADSESQREEFERVFKRIPDYVVFIRHDVNKGKGAAIKTALKRVQQDIDGGKSIKGIVTVDADGQHLTSDIVKVVNSFVDNSDALILGSRELDKNVPFRSKFGNSITRLIFAGASGVKVRDTQTGLRAFNSKLIPFMLEVEGDRYEYEMNMLLDVARKKIEIKEITIETVYLEGNKTSHFRVIRDSVLIYKRLLKFSASSLIAFFVDYIMLFAFKTLYGKGISEEEKLLFMSVLSARIISSLVNYCINKYIVFKNRTDKKSMVKYYILAVMILAMNYIMLDLLNIRIGVPLWIAKILVEIVLFILSYNVQRRFVFKKE